MGTEHCSTFPTDRGCIKTQKFKETTKVPENAQMTLSFYSLKYEFTLKNGLKPLIILVVRFILRPEGRS